MSFGHSCHLGMVLLAGLEELTKPEACSEKNATRRVLVSYWLLNLSCKPSSISDGPEQNHGCIPSQSFPGLQMICSWRRKWMWLP